MPELREVAAVFVAGGVGAAARLVLSTLIDEHGARVPHLGTLVVNLVGCLAIGLLAAVIPRGPWRTIFGAGLLGGFTTYSAFALIGFESLASGRWAVTAGQCAAHLFGGIAAVALGAYIGGLLSPPSAT